MAEELNMHFSSVFTREDTSSDGACPEHLFIPCERAATSDSSDVPAASWCASSF